MTSSHVLFVLCTVGMLVTVVCAWRRRAILTSKFWRTAAGSFVHHADAGVTFPIVAYATCCMLYCSQLGGEGMLLYWAWTWVVICVFVVGSTNVLFLCHLPSWIRHGLPPSFPWEIPRRRNMWYLNFDFRCIVEQVIHGMYSIDLLDNFIIFFFKKKKRKTFTFFCIVGSYRVQQCILIKWKCFILYFI